jgi:hypothetical protein
MEVALALAALVIPLWLNVKATQLVSRDVLSERRQKVAQLLFVWLVPLIGAVVVLAIHRPAEPPSRQYRKPVDPSDDYAFSGRTIRNTKDVLDGDD